LFDLDFSKIAVVSAVALVVIGPEKLPGVARTLGTMLGKAKRYVSDVKAEVNRTMELDELKKMKETKASAARDVEHARLMIVLNRERRKSAQHLPPRLSSLMMIPLS
jgi:sec-independent protein translocase protein TatB